MLRTFVIILCLAGRREETVVETLDYKGHTYVFCNEKEKADFISDPRKYAGQ